MIYFEDSREDVSDRYFECSNIVLPQGTVYTLYIADSGIFAIVLPISVHRDFYLFLRDIFGTSRIRMYVLEAGLYDHITDSTGPLLSDEALSEHINSWIFSDSPVWDKTAIADLSYKILFRAAVHRGEFVDSEGNVFILRNKKFVSVSPRRFDSIFFLALFGGVWGLHRFSVGKFFSGVLYLLTGGLFLVGWFLDVISLLGGVFKDSKGKYLVPPKNRANRLLWLPVGIFVSVTSFFIISSFFSVFLSSLNSEIYTQIHNSDGYFVEKFSSEAENFIRNFQFLTGD